MLVKIIKIKKVDLEFIKFEDNKINAFLKKKLYGIRYIKKEYSGKIRI